VRADPGDRDGALPPIEVALARRGRHDEDIITFSQRRLPTAISPIAAGPTYLDDFVDARARSNAQVPRVSMGFRSPRRKRSFPGTGGM
jgi:hypothetical protein